MDIDKKRHGGKTVFNLTGSLDTKTAPALQNVLLPEFEISKNIELNFSGLDYVSSAGLRVLISGEKTAHCKNVCFTIANVSQEVMEIFIMTGFDSVLTIV